MMQNQSDKKPSKDSSFSRSKILRIITSALLAFGLWFYVISVERTETEQEYTGVEVVLDGETVLEERGLKIISDKDMTVKLKLNGRRSVLNKLRTSDITVRVDLTRIYEAGTKNLSYDIEYPGDVQESSIEVVSRNPDAITLTVAAWATKRVDLLDPQIVGTPATGYRVGDAITQEHKTVSLSGPKEIIDKIHSAGVVVNVEGVSESQEMRMSFLYYDEQGNQVTDTDSVTANPDKTLVRVPILKDKNVGIHLPLTFGEAAEDGEFTMTVSVALANGEKTDYTGVVMVENGAAVLSGDALRQSEDGMLYFDLGTVTAFGSAGTMSYVTEAELPLLELADEYQQTYTREDIDLQQDGASCDVDSVTVSIAVRRKVMGEIRGVSVPGIPSGATCTPLTIQIKGFAEDLEKVDKADILVTLNTIPVVSGKYDVIVTVEGHPEITVVGEYQVEVKLPSVKPTVDFL